MSQIQSIYTYEQMLHASHNGTDMVRRDKKEDIISYEQMVFIMRVLMFGVTPAISILGIVGNIFSIIILLKHGFHKCSNILLISLAVTDLSFLVAFNSVPKILYEIVGVENGYGYNREVSLALYVLYTFFNIIDYTGGTVSLMFPMLITFERLVTVYIPFKCHLIITPARTWCAVGIVITFWLTSFLYMSFWMTFSYTYDLYYNTSVGRMERSTLYGNSQRAGTVEALEAFFDYMAMKIPPVVTLVGCIFISVKVKMASSRRKKLTQASTKDASNNRTTKMLLAVCVIYMLTCAIISLPHYLPQYVQFSVFSEAPSNLGPVMYQGINIALCINSSANFVVYVALNKKFRDTYKSLIPFCREPRRQASFLSISFLE